MWKRQADDMLGTARGRHTRGNSLYEKIARRDNARAKRRWLFSMAGLCSATFLFWLFHRNAAIPSSEAAVPKQKIAFVVLTDPRENHEENVIPMLRHVEQKYGWTNHPYYIMIDGQTLPDEAVQNATSEATNGKSTWILIDRSVGWGKPDHIPDDILNVKVPEQYHHFFPVGYHNMCRFYGGFAYSHPLLKQYDYFWRLDSNVKYLCVPPFDPAQYVMDNDLDYGFIHAEPDAIVTLDGFGDVLKNFLANGGEEMTHPKSNYKRWLFDHNDEYTFASVYNNFEIVSRRFFESKEYQAWFNWVDQNSTGIYSRRYGDAPIRSAGLSMFVDPEKVAWFGRQIGYEHEWMLATPEEPWKSMYCDELPSMEFKLPANSHLEWFGDYKIKEPAFEPEWLLGR